MSVFPSDLVYLFEGLLMIAGKNKIRRDILLI